MSLLSNIHHHTKIHICKFRLPSNLSMHRPMLEGGSVQLYVQCYILACFVCIESSTTSSSTFCPFCWITAIDSDNFEIV